MLLTKHISDWSITKVLHHTTNLLLWTCCTLYGTQKNAKARQTYNISLQSNCRPEATLLFLEQKKAIFGPNVFLNLCHPNMILLFIHRKLNTIGCCDKKMNGLLNFMKSFSN